MKTVTPEDKKELHDLVNTFKFDLNVSETWERIETAVFEMLLKRNYCKAEDRFWVVITPNADMNAVTINLHGLDLSVIAIEL